MSSDKVTSVQDGNQNGQSAAEPSKSKVGNFFRVVSTGKINFYLLYGKEESIGSTFGGFNTLLVLCFIIILSGLQMSKMFQAQYNELASDLSVMDVNTVFPFYNVTMEDTGLGLNLTLVLSFSSSFNPST